MYRSFQRLVNVSIRALEAIARIIGMIFNTAFHDRRSTLITLGISTVIYFACNPDLFYKCLHIVIVLAIVYLGCKVMFKGVAKPGKK